MGAAPFVEPDVIDAAPPLLATIDAEAASAAVTAPSLADTTPVPAVRPTDLPQAPVTRGQILRLEQAMLPHSCVGPEAVHHFAPGMYLREFTMPAGMLVTGKTHRHAHFLMVSKGRALVHSEFGRQEVEAGHISVSQPGVKRVVYALEETTFVCIHANPDDTQDLELIEARQIVAQAPEEIEHALQGLLE